MNNPIITITTCGFLISVYVFVYKFISAGFKAVSNYRNARKTEQERLLREQTMLKYLCNLSRSEIAILKFILKQSSCAAQLPDQYKPIMLLIEKGYLVQIGDDSKPISDFRLMFDYSLAHLFSIPDNIQQLIKHMPPEFSKKLRKTKPDRILKECQ